MGLFYPDLSSWYKLRSLYMNEFGDSPEVSVTVL